MGQGVAFVDGAYIDAADAKLSIFDLGFIRSDVVYDVVSTWKGLPSPIAITFLTMPVEAAGSVYVLKRLMRMTSDTSFSVTDQFSVDGGPFRRLGNGSYFKVQ